MNKYTVSEDYTHHITWAISSANITGSVRVFIKNDSDNPAHKLGTEVITGFDGTTTNDGKVLLKSNTILQANEVIPYKDHAEIKDFCWVVRDIRHITSLMEDFIAKCISSMHEHKPDPFVASQ